MRMKHHTANKVERTNFLVIFFTQKYNPLDSNSLSVQKFRVFQKAQRNIETGIQPPEGLPYLH